MSGITMAVIFFTVLFAVFFTAMLNESSQT